MQLASISSKIKGTKRGRLGAGGEVAVGPMSEFIGDKSLIFLIDLFSKA